MKRVGMVLFTMLAVALLCGSVMAQPVGDNSVYWVTYFSNANTKNAPDGTLRLINDGTQATSCPDGACNGTLWADIYVFDDSEEMIACCSCYVSADGLLSESVDQQLVNPSGPTGPGVIGSTFSTRGEFERGVIKVISSSNNNPTVPSPTPGLRGWMTHIQGSSVSKLGTANPVEASPFYVTETPLSDSNLSLAEIDSLGYTCSYGVTTESNYGWCGCSPEDEDF